MKTYTYFYSNAGEPYATHRAAEDRLRRIISDHKTTEASIKEATGKKPRYVSTFEIVPADGGGFKVKETQTPRY